MSRPPAPRPPGPITSLVSPSLPLLTLIYSPPPRLPSSHLFFFFFSHFSSVCLGFPPLFLSPFLFGAGGHWGFALSPLQVSVGGVVSFPSPTTLGFLGFFWSLPSSPNPSSFLGCFFFFFSLVRFLIIFFFFAFLHAEVCMTHVVEGERLRKVQGSVCVACLNAMCVDVVRRAPAQRAPLKTSFSFFLLFSPFRLSPLFFFSLSLFPLPEAGLAVPLSAASRQDGPAVPSRPWRPSRRPLALTGASQARPPAPLPLCLAAPATPRPGPPPAAPHGAQPQRLQQRLGGLGLLPPARPRQDPRHPRQEVRGSPGAITEEPQIGSIGLGLQGWGAGGGTPGWRLGGWGSPMMVSQ